MKRIIRRFSCSRRAGAIIAAALLFSVPAYAQGTAPTGPVKALPQDSRAKSRLTDAEFVNKAALAGMAEVEISKLAETRSTNKKIKKFAAKMVKDHSAANARLKEVADKNRLDLPGGLDAVRRKVVADLQGLSGEAFDRAYVDVMKKDHDSAVGLFDNAAGEPTLNAELRVFANKELPTLRAHQKQAHALITGPAASVAG